MIKRTIFSSLALATLGGLLFSSCTSTTSPGTSVPGNVQVTSATTTSVTVSWTRDASDNGADTVFVMSGTTNAGASPVTVQSPSSSVTVTGLTVGTPYSISVHSSNGASTAITYTIAGLPTNLGVNSASATSIGAAWTRGTADNGVDTIVAMNGGNVAAVATTTASNGVVTGLSEGVKYDISVHMSSGATSSITWMTAQRSTGIKIYETKDPSSGDPSALVLASNATDAISLSGASNADLVLDDVSGIPSGISLDAGILYNTGWNATRVYPTAAYVPGGLNSDYRTADYSAELIGASANAYELPDDAGYSSKGSAVLTVETADGHLALIEIVPDASTGKLYSVSPAGYKYVTVNVSYQSQPAATAPYAARPAPSGPVSRNSAQ